MADARPPHPEALLLFPLEVPSNLQLTFEMVLTSLYRQAALAASIPYKWGFIDKPKDGDVYMIHHRGGPLTDGLMYLEQEHRYTVPKQTHGPEVECFEARQGFIPGQDNQAFRIRRRFHFLRPHPQGSPQLFIVHYSRSPTPVPIAPHLHQQIRNYPLPPLPPINVFVAGPRAGEMVREEEAHQIIASSQSRGGEQTYNQQRPPQPSHHSSGTGYPGISQNLQSHTQNLAELDRRARMAAPPVRRDEEDSPDEDSSVSVRTLASSRYRRNHELMEEVFYRAAFGIRKPEEPLESSVPPLKLEDILAKLSSTEADIVELERKAAERQRIRDEREQASEVMST